jgi:hypothetical protein
MDEMSQIVRLHYPEISAPLLDSALAIFYRLRQQGFEKPPATAELLDWLGALQLDGVTRLAQESEISYLGVLLKRTQDLLHYQAGDRDS